MRTEIRKSREPVGLQDILKLESEIGLSLPNEYRAFLLKHNGGRPKPDAFPIFGNAADNQGLVHSFLCVRPGDVYHLPDWIRRYQERLPEGFIPVAVDQGGNLVCIATIGEQEGQVFFWDHEEEVDEGEKPGFQNVYFISDGFQNFLDNLSELE
jgi:cell wall assembly regulator SMI1